MKENETIHDVFQDSDILNLGTGSVSWWESNGPGCKPVYLANQTTLEQAPWRPLRPSYVTDCLIEYHHLEVLQASLHVVLSVSTVFMFLFSTIYLL